MWVKEDICMQERTHLCFLWVVLRGKCAACLCMWTQVTPSVCVCSWLCFVSIMHLCVCVCVCVTLSPIYLENGYVWPILPDFLALGKQTDSHSLCIVLKRWRLLVLERDLGLLVFDLHVVSVWYRSWTITQLKEGKRISCRSSALWCQGWKEQCSMVHGPFLHYPPRFLSCVRRNGKTLPGGGLKISLWSWWCTLR